MKMRPGSYNGVPFFATTADTDSGRRVAVTEYPQRDKANADDMGAKARRFTLEMLVLGEDCLEQRDALAAMLEMPGRGELIHPWRGKLAVIPVSVRTREAATERRIARLTVEFVEAEADDNVSLGIAVPSYELNGAADALDIISLMSFADTFTVEGPVSLLAAAEKAVTSGLNTIKAVSGRLNSLNDLAARIRNISQGITSLVLSPSTLGLQLAAAIHTITDTHFNPLGALKTQLNLLAQSLGTVDNSIGTSTSRQSATNANAVTTLIRSLALAETVRLFSGEIHREAVTDTASRAGAVFDTRNEAAAIRDAMLVHLDALLLDADDRVYPALMNTQAVIMAQYPAIAPTATLETISAPGNLPALVIAQRLYGSAAMADDLISRNRIAHPLFVPAGADLEVRRG